MENIHILDATAALYMIPIDRYNKNYDMFNIGNLGFKGEERTNRKFKRWKTKNNFNKKW